MLYHIILFPQKFKLFQSLLKNLNFQIKFKPLALGMPLLCLRHLLKI
jgi:hypothetical protein